MIPNEGLIHTHPVALAVVALIIGVIVWTVLMVSASGLRHASDVVLAAAALRGGSPLLQQVMQRVVQRKPMRFWAIVFAVPTVFPPILFLVGRTLLALGDGVFAALAGWWPIIGFGFLVVAAGLVTWVLARTRKPQPQPYVLDAPVQVQPQPVPEMWSAPPLAENWKQS